MNALQSETSPYLLQHVDNPVEWYPWGPDALEKAQREGKPILLSVGYSACHWCHVMAHESFEDEDTAAIMNREFVNIKVDREERPDLDKIYQNAHYLLTQRNGGWPLTMFLTPDDRIPFFGGTYFPPEPRHGLPGFSDLLNNVATAYREKESAIREQNGELLAALNDAASGSGIAPDGVIDDTPITTAREQSARLFDHRLGGFGRAPKFPHPTGLERLLRDYFRNDDDHARHMTLFTLRRMALGGIQDHLGGGFCRYSTDNQWLIPHFEKMLYDNGPLLALYAQAWQIDGDPLFRDAATGIIEWLDREMTAIDGGFFSSIDADSEGQEGTFYVWEKHEIEKLLGEGFEIFARRFGLLKKPNFEGRWHLHVVADYREISNVSPHSADEIERRVEADKSKLFAYREKRVHPACDEKILTAWNALMIKGLAVAANILDEPGIIDRAHRCIDFIRQNLWIDGQLLATSKDGNAHLNAYLDDYAFLIDALLHCLSVKWRRSDLSFCVDLADRLLEEFEDHQYGGFYFTAHHHEHLIQRTKSYTDDALPAGNALAAQSLQCLGHMLGETRYLKAAERTIKNAWEPVTQSPSAHYALLNALQDYLEPPTLAIVRGSASNIAPWQREAAQCPKPGQLLFAIPHSENDLPGVLGQHASHDRTVGYVCTGHQCSAPTEDLGTFLKLWNGTSE